MVWMSRRPDSSVNSASVIEETSVAEATFRVMSSLQQRWGAGSCGRYIVSFTNSLSDLLEVLLLQRAAGLSPGELRPVPLLEQLGYRVWAPNLRGYGRSDKPSGRRAYTMDELEQDVTDLIDASGASSVLLVGHVVLLVVGDPNDAFALVATVPALIVIGQSVTWLWRGKDDDIKPRRNVWLLLPAVAPMLAAGWLVMEIVVRLIR